MIECLHGHCPVRRTQQPAQERSWLLSWMKPSAVGGHQLVAAASHEMWQVVARHQLVVPLRISDWLVFQCITRQLHLQLVVPL